MIDLFNINETYQKIFDSYPDIELEPHVRKLIEMDRIYPYNATFFCITNTVTKQFEFVSKNFKAITGITTSDLKEKGMESFWSRIHPEDLQLWLESMQRLMQFTMTELTLEQRKRMSYTWNYRFKMQNNTYVQIVQNTTPIQFDKNLKPVIGLAHYTVLTGMEQIDVCASAKLLNTNNEYETLFHCNITNNYLLSNLSLRERDIIRLLTGNFTSQEIADKLFISKHTVDTHRRNIIKKLGFESTAQLKTHFSKNSNLL